MRYRLKSLLRRGQLDSRGAMSIEKILIIALIALPILIALVLFKNDLEKYFSNQKSSLNSAQQADPNGTGGSSSGTSGQGGG